MSHAANVTSAAPSPGFEPGTSGFDRAGVYRRGWVTRREEGAQREVPVRRAAVGERGVAESAHPGDGVGDRVGAAAAASPSGRVGPAPVPHALELHGEVPAAGHADGT